MSPPRRRIRAALLGLLGASAVTAFVLLLVTARSDGPIGMLPGGVLRGPEVPCPASGWNRVAGERESELEIQPERPRSIRTWNVVHDDSLYLPGDFLTPWKRWPYQLEADGRVRLRIGGKIYVCRATRVQEEPLVAALRTAIGRKYALAPDGLAARTEVWWFRIGPR